MSFLLFLLPLQLFLHHLSILFCFCSLGSYYLLFIVFVYLVTLIDHTVKLLWIFKLFLELLQHIS